MAEKYELPEIKQLDIDEFKDYSATDWARVHFRAIDRATYELLDLARLHVPDGYAWQKFNYMIDIIFDASWALRNEVERADKEKRNA